MDPTKLSAAASPHSEPAPPTPAAAAPAPAVRPDPSALAPCPLPSPLRQRMRQDMELAGLASQTQAHYIAAVVALQRHYQRRPDKLAEPQVYQYFLWLRDQQLAPRGTFQSHYYGLRFFYYRCLAVDWPLFTRKRVRSPA